MSNTQIFAFVEGKTDRHFYGRICEAVCGSSVIAYEVRMAQELPGNSGGKGALLTFFDYLRQQSSLLNHWQGKSTGSIFFLDKDVDDGRTLRRSNHVVYTKYYSFENHVFKEADLAEAAAAAAYLDSNSLRFRFGNYEAWRRKVAGLWKEWVTLCLFEKRYGVSCGCNYGTTSQINTPDHGSADMNAYSHHLQLLEVSSNLSHQQFIRAFGRVRRLVDKLYAKGEHDLVFKGKWYTGFLEAEIKRIAGSSIVAKGLSQRLRVSVAMTLDYDQPWAEHFKAPLRWLLQQL